MEQSEYIPISGNAIRLSLSSHLLTLISDELTESSKDSLRILMNSIMEPLLTGNESDTILMSYLNFISKFTDNHDLEAKTAQAMLNSSDTAETRKQIATNIDEFISLGREEQFQVLFNFLIAMNVNVEEGYKELDAIEAQANLQ